MMRSGNPNPTKARQAKKTRSRPNPGTIQDLRTALWEAIDTLRKEVKKKPEVGDLTKLTHALSQTAGVYLKAIEVGEFEARLAAIETMMEETKLRRAA